MRLHGTQTAPDLVRRPGQTVAELIAGHLRWRGVERVYGLCGGHIQPVWDALARLGVRIVDVRHECAAVFMAHAEAELTGRPGVALVTAGPGLTNAVTGVASASTARAPCSYCPVARRGRKPGAALTKWQLAEEQRTLVAD
jgi:glyoxylate carboligase